MKSGQPVGVDLHPHLAGPSRVQGDARHVLHLGQPVKELLGHTAQVIVGVNVLKPVVRVQGQPHDGDIIDLHRLDHPAGHDGRSQVPVLENGVVQLDERVLAVLAHEKADRHGGHVLARDGVDVLHAVDLPEQPFKRRGDELFHFLGGCARHLDQHVGHGHHDLRLLLARGDEDGGHAKQQGGHSQDDRHLRGQEKSDDGRQDALDRFQVVFHHCPPSVPMPMPTVSPPDNPDRTSTRPSSISPVRTYTGNHCSPSLTMTVSN